jgi:hypothetical protein
MELEETGKIAAAIQRMTGSHSGSADWKHALYHGLSMSGAAMTDELRLIREALKLP